ncbi:MAG: proline--tRNA ligase, partial [Thermoplasmata archaeon]|nr:proline--tRNA ligase [Thermoplasmata archaeon]
RGRVAELVFDIQRDLYDEATRRRDERTAEVSTLEDALEAAKTGFARVPWAAVGEEGEARLAREAVTVRCLQRADGSVPDAGEETDLVAVVARSY